MSETNEKLKWRWWPGKYRRKTQSHPSESVKSDSVRPERVSHLPNPQADSERASLPDDSPPPIHIPCNQSGTPTDGKPSRTQQPQNFQESPDSETNKTSQARLEQSSCPQDKLGPPLFIIGTLWKEAVECLDKGNRGKLNKITHRRGNPPLDGHGDDLLVAVSSVLSEAENYRNKDEEGTWKPVSPESPGTFS